MLLRTGAPNRGKGDPTQIWASLLRAASRLHQVPLHADDRSRTVGDIRAKTRRLKRNAAGLALVVVDYGAAHAHHGPGPGRNASKKSPRSAATADPSPGNSTRP